VLTTDQKGAVAELAIARAGAELGVGVFKPLTDGERYDLIFEIGSKLYRVQCKYARFRREVIVIRCYSARRAREGFRKRTYCAAEWISSPRTARSWIVASFSPQTSSTIVRKSTCVSAQAGTINGLESIGRRTSRSTLN
jgi:hypothetical protein